MHVPVLLEKVLLYLNLQEGDTVLDATIDGGGHAIAMLARLSSKGVLIGIDQDAELLESTELKLKSKNKQAKCKIVLLNGNFRDLDKLFEPLKIKSLNVALFDLGMSSDQLDLSGRGFSFKKDEPLLMNLKSPLTEKDLTAMEIVNSWSADEIYEILKTYGEERFAGPISRKIVESRKIKHIKTTLELVEVINRSVPAFYKQGRRIHFATKTFQALRIAVNDELNALKEGLLKSWEYMKPEGKIAVISFHSLEDRIVKNFFREKHQKREGVILTKKPIQSLREEIFLNPRARSAKLRVIKKN
ncbi:MAG: 16S rRNA (cytosine(1402)-N(4))-methyltransferase RsmH [bacterium]|nr:16S rRNA (cytosine(1402)-N(4))-methyltransferase RsmH [bacterium]